MAEAILDLRLDTVQPNRVRLVYGVQNDYNSRFLAVRFTVNGKPIDIESVAAVRINAKRPDGAKDAFPGTVNTDGTVKVPVAQWMLEVPGEVSASVTAVTSNSALTTQDFYIMAKPSNWDGTGAPSEEDPNKDVIQTIIVSENERVVAEKQRAETFAEMEERFAHWDDSIAPSASVTQTAEGANIRLKDKNGETTATVKSAYGSAKAGGYTGTEAEFEEDTNPDNIKAEVNADAESFIVSELAKRGQLKPEFANSIEECTDTTKMYVLPDGFIYAYFEKKSTQLYTNRLLEADTTKRLASDATVSEANIKEGYITGHRLNSSGLLKAETTMSATGFIPCQVGDIIRMKGVTDSTSTYTRVLAFYDASGTKLDTDGPANLSSTAVSGWTISDGLITVDTSKIAGAAAITNCVSFRFCAGSFENAIITVNQDIVEGGSAGGLSWNNTGHAFVPADYEERILELEQRIDNIGTNNTSGTIDLAYIREWDMPIYDANIPVFETTATKAAISESELNCASLYAKYDALMAQYPAYIAKRDHGLCSDGVTHMYQYDIKTPDTYHTGSLYSEVKPKAILMSGIHREYACAYGLYYAIEEIVSNPDLRHFLNNVHLIVFPCANPYAFNKENGTHYQNANGVEIHRNFEVGFVNYEAEGDDQYSGSAPLSEIESQVIDGVMRTNKDSAFVMSAHTYNNAKDGTTDHRVMWCSAGTLYTCNLACRLIQKMSVSFRKRFGNQFTGDNLSEPMGYVSVSGTGGSEYRQATKYGIQGFNLEVSETFSPTDTTQRTSFAMTRYAEVYANMIITAFGVYDYKDKDKYCKYVKD